MNPEQISETLDNFTKLEEAAWGVVLKRLGVGEAVGEVIVDGRGFEFEVLSRSVGNYYEYDYDRAEFVSCEEIAEWLEENNDKS